MRRLATLLKYFREVSDNDSITGEEMFERTRFTELQEALEL